ncbi:hypothetical protein VTN00DRAFT_1691 [Thermoascus crustaceus]|uniref:uncharacterized protein n=1 Tax=Thermoascus crustaceus TaxID=5088 RepID=UPI0037438964
MELVTIRGNHDEKIKGEDKANRQVAAHLSRRRKRGKASSTLAKIKLNKKEMKDQVCPDKLDVDLRCFRKWIQSKSIEECQVKAADLKRSLVDSH